MHLTDADYWRDAVAMVYADNLEHDAVYIAVQLACTGAQFNAAIWAAIKLREIAMSEVTNSAFRWAPITPSDTDKIVPFPVAVFVGGGGTVRAVGDDDVAADFVVAAGSTLHIQPQKIMATGTTATNLVGMRND